MRSLRTGGHRVRCVRDPALRRRFLCAVFALSTWLSLARSRADDEFTSFEFHPFVFAVDKPNDVELRVRTTRDNVDSIAFDTRQIADIFLPKTLVLRDEGDGSFVGTLRVAKAPDPGTTQLLLRTANFQLRLENGETVTIAEDVGASVGLLDQRRDVAVDALAPDVYASRNVVHIRRDDLLSGGYPTHEIDRVETARVFYEFFPDVFDWLVFFHVGNTRSRPSASAAGVRNSVEGIGRRLFDRSADFGSDGVLRGTIQIYTKHTRGLTHEIFHTWGVWGFDVFGLDSVVAGAGHWGPLASGEAGTIFGAPPTLGSLSANGDDVFCGPWMREPSPFGLELYLMGLAPASAVGTYDFVRDAEFNSSDCDGYSFRGSELGTIDADTLIAAFGPRVPGYPDQDVFRIAPIVVSGRALEPIEWDYLTRTFAAHEAQFARDLYGLARLRYLTGDDRYVRGDATQDGAVNVSDAVSILDCLFGRTRGCVDCHGSADANGDGLIDVSDGLFLLFWLFSEGDPPPAPFPGCGSSAESRLRCAAFRACPQDSGGACDTVAALQPSAGGPDEVLSNGTVTQVFRAESSGRLTGVEFIAESRREVGALLVEVLDLSEHPPASAPVLAVRSMPAFLFFRSSTRLDGSSVTATFAELSGAELEIESGDRLGIRLRTTGGGEFAIGTADGNPYADGSFYRRSDEVPNVDLSFKVCVAPAR